MRKSNTQPLGEVLREYVRAMNMDHKLKEVDVVQSWETLLGKTIAGYTRNVFLSKQVLYVEISSSVVKSELVMMREEIRTRLNELAGEEMVLKIVFK
jgi:predicted nucleic acid-binding Zn ribbon protein